MLRLEKFEDLVETISDGYRVSVGGRIIDSYIKILEETCGDKANWISWYVFENDWGSRGMEAGYEGEMKPIKNYKDLWRLINS